MRVAAMAVLILLPLKAAGARAQADPAPAPLPPRVRAWQTGLLRADRLQHLSLAFTIGLGTGLATREPAGAGGAALGLGLVKEIRDRRRTGFDPMDLLADALGAALAALATRAVSR
jgi:hypothetical protein